MYRILFFLLFLVVEGRANPSAPEEGSSLYVADLAWRYLEKEVTNDEAARINDEVRALQPDEMRRFMEELKVLGGASEEQSIIADRIVEEAIKRGIAPFEVDVEIVYEAFEEIAISYRNHCPIGDFHCTVWSPAYPTTLYGGSCGFNCTTGTWMDRQSTEDCETGGCDHRFHFPAANKTTIDGKTTAYDNWILAYPSILGEHWDSSTYAVLGHGQMLLSGIFIPSASKLQVY